MHSLLPITLLSLLTLLTLAKDIPITVGANAQLAYSPSTITAAIGDTLTFSYFPKNHSVVQSSFADPCQPLSGGFFSGFQPLAAGPGPVEFVVTVNDTKPIWIYCAQTTGRHCQMGMAMVVNQPAPPSPNTLDAYKLAAAKTGNSTAPPRIAGGVFVPLNSTSTSGRSTASGTASGVVASSTGTRPSGSAGVRPSSSAGLRPSGSAGGSPSSGGSNSGPSSCSSCKGGSGSGSPSSGSGYSNTGSGSSNSGVSSSTPSGSPKSYQGAAIKFATGLTVNIDAPGIVACALV